MRLSATFVPPKFPPPQLRFHLILYLITPYCTHRLYFISPHPLHFTWSLFFVRPAPPVYHTVGRKPLPPPNRPPTKDHASPKARLHRPARDDKSVLHRPTCNLKYSLFFLFNAPPFQGFRHQPWMNPDPERPLSSSGQRTTMIIQAQDDPLPCSHVPILHRQRLQRPTRVIRSSSAFVRWTSRRGRRPCARSSRD